MSRLQSAGIDYFPVSVDFFDDPKIKILKSRYGTDGVAIYMYLLCRIYREGYFTRVDKDFSYIMSDDLNMTADKCAQVLAFLLERSMFDEQLFKTDATLTSADIQRNWMFAVKKRAAKTPITVNGKYWLLDKTEMAMFPRIIPTHGNSSPKKGLSSAKNEDNSAKNSTIVENSIEDSIERENARAYNTYGGYGNIELTEAEYSKLTADYSKCVIDRLIEEMSRYLKCNGKSYKNFGAALEQWAEREKTKGTAPSGYAGARPNAQVVHTHEYTSDQLRNLTLIDITEEIF